MAERLSDNEARKYLWAFADGELDVEQNLRVLEHVNMHREAAERVAHQQALREITRRAMREMTPALPPSLRASVLAMMEEPAEAPDAVAGRIRLRPLWMKVTAVAAVLALTGGVILMSLSHTPGLWRRSEPVLVAANRTDALINRHVSCSRAIEKLRAFVDDATDVRRLPDLVAAELGGAVYRSLDLSGAGFRFVGAGRCRIPADRATHLIYESAVDASSSGSAAPTSLSLWICPDRDTTSADLDQMHVIRGPGSLHPVVTWRHDGMRYYVVGDSYADVERAFRTMAVALR